MANANSFTVTYIGGPTAIFEIGGLRIMTDPTLDPPGCVYPPSDLKPVKTLGPAPIPIGEIDIVLLSHDQHYDNFDLAGRELVKKVRKTYTTEPGAGRIKGNSVGLVPWQTVHVPSPEGIEIHITATPARHGPAGSQKIQGQVTGFLLTIGNDAAPAIYLTGDTVYYEGVAEVARRYRPKYVFPFAGAAQPRGPFTVTMRTNDVIDTALDFPESTIIPLHFEGWAHLTQNAADIQRSYQILDTPSRLRILEAGVPTTLEL
jgi:L-ascorbate metabolism protein UlaG (beta-lactamase superfamily)